MLTRGPESLRSELSVSPSLVIASEGRELANRYSSTVFGDNMQVRCPKRTECREPPHELNGLQFAAELQLENVAHLHLVGGRQAEGLQSLLSEASYWRSKPTHSQRYRRRRTAVGVMGIRGAQNRCARFPARIQHFLPAVPHRPTGSCARARSPCSCRKQSRSLPTESPPRTTGWLSGRDPRLRPSLSQPP